MAWIGNETRPGLYLTFKEAAIAQIKGGVRGIVAMPLHSYDSVNGTATVKSVHKVTTEKEASDLYGADYIEPIKHVLQGGAKEVLVYLMPEFDESTYAQDCIDARAKLETYPFNVFVFDRENIGVVEGLTSAKDSTTTTQLNVDAGAATLVQTNGDHRTLEIAATTFDTGATANATFYLDLDPDGTLKFATSHSVTDDYIPVAEVTTDSVGDISLVTDVRLLASTEQDNVLTWTQTKRDEGKHFFSVFGGNSYDDQDPVTGDSRTLKLFDDYAVNLIVGIDIEGKEYSSGAYAPYLAGLIAGTPINKSITYDVIPADDVNKRLVNSEIVTALQNGSLVLVHDGEKVKVEQGLTTSVEKIRAISARQAVSTDVERTASDSYIGKVDNNDEGQTALINAIKNYLENLEASNVLTEIEVGLDPQYNSIGDSVYLLISYREIDSMERIFLTINV